MKLFSQTAELKAIKSITYLVKEKPSRASFVSPVSMTSGAYLLASLDTSYFHYEPCRAAYARISSMVKKRSIVLSYSDLVEDLSLSEEYRDILSQYTKKPAVTIESAKLLVETLGKYRKARILYNSAKSILDKLKAEEIDVDRVLDDVSNRITEARTQTIDHDPILTIGKDANALDLIDEALSTEDDILIKTGFVEFDRRSGGFPAEGVVLLAGTTSGGKSVLRMNLLANIYKLNKLDVATVSFEMNSKKETRRFLSYITGIPFWKFTKKLLSEEERNTCRAAWNKFHVFGEKNECRYSLMCPTRGLNITQLLMILKPYSYNVIAIDYISLLDGVDEGKEAMILKGIVRECKIFSGQNKCLIILLAQLDSEAGHIRYSRGMLEDSDSAWVWNYTSSEDRDRHCLPIKQKKARDQEPYDFELEEDFAHMRVGNTEEQLEEDKRPKNGNYQKHQDKASKIKEEDPLDNTGIEYSVE